MSPGSDYDTLLRSHVHIDLINAVVTVVQKVSKITNEERDRLHVQHVKHNVRKMAGTASSGSLNRHIPAH